MLVVEEVAKRFGEVRALDGVSLTVAPGEVTALLGPNGAGKTTLVSCVAGLVTPDAGRVVVAGIDARRDRSAARRQVGLAPQELGLYPVLAVRDNLRLFGELAGLRGVGLRRRVEEVAEALALTDLLDRRAGLLSGGQQRRVHTAMALVHRPAVLLLDEPTVGADVETRGQLLDAVRRLAAEGAAVCYTTHYLPEVEALGARVVVLAGGRVVSEGSVEELVRAHADSALELHLDGPVPDLPGAVPVQGRPGVVRVVTRDPAGDLARLVAQLPPSTSLLGVDVVRAGLEAAYLALAGVRVGQEDAA